jgi:hypothetical protein
VFSRLYSATQSKYQQNNEAMTLLLRLVLALSFEIRSARLKSSDISGRQDRYFRLAAAGRREQAPHPIDAVFDRYPGTDIDDDVLTDEVLFEIFEKGLFDGQKICGALEQSSHFVAAGAEPVWRTVWHVFDRDDHVVQSALVELERQFRNREILEPGVILHVLGIRLWECDAGLLSLSRAEATKDGKKYIDDLRKVGKLAPLPFAYAPYDLDTGFEGFGFREAETAEFKEIAKYLEVQRSEVRQEKLPALGENILQEMDKSADLFFRRLTLSSSEDSLYGRVPVLHTIEPKLFIEKLLGKTASEQRRILLTFRSRYESGGLDGELIAEKPWLASVRTELESRLPELSPLAQYRLRRLIEPIMGKFLNNSE